MKKNIGVFTRVYFYAHLNFYLKSVQNIELVLQIFINILMCLIVILLIIINTNLYKIKTK